MTLTYSAPAAYVFVFVCEKEQHFILEEVFKKEKKKISKFWKMFFVCGLYLVETSAYSFMSPVMDICFWSISYNLFELRY